MAADERRDEPLSAAADAKRLLRLARNGALATLERETGAPLTSFVGCASDFDGSPLFLLSGLARHTRNLGSDPHASLLLTSPAGRGDPLNRPRVSLGGLIHRHPDAHARKRYLQRNPKAKLYSPFADFTIYRMEIESVHFNGGFGRAEPLIPADLLIPKGDAVALIEAEDDLLQDINALGGPLAGRPAARDALRGRIWRAIGLDAEGLDLAAGSHVARIDFRGRAFDPADWRRRLDETLAGRGA